MNLRVLYFVICVLSYRFSSGQRLVSRGKTIFSSSFVNTWTADKAVDGDARRAPNRCDCCAATRNESEPWYKLDLGQLYMIYSISVLGRGGAGDYHGGWGQTLENMQIKLGTTQSNGQEITRYTGNDYTYNYTLPTPQEGRYLTLTLLGRTQYFTICELLVYAACEYGEYGRNCAEVCGSCYNNAACNRVDGNCLGCAPGYMGSNCKNECDDGFFGYDCTQTCFCLNSTCDKATGICPAGGCKEGYKGDKCDTPCEYGKYGKNCEENCGSCYNNLTCDNFYGSCQRCLPGFRELQCKQICRNGTYGQDCSEICGQCYNNEACNHVDGNSTKCAAGYKGADCKTECDSRTFGVNCLQECGHCFNRAQCNTVNGSCPTGCDPGFDGVLCNATCDLGRYGEKCDSSCGHCYQQDTCDAVTGLCTNNCSAGYDGAYCKEACPVGKFGRNCISSCGNCLNQTICSRFDGSCDAGCELGYKPPFCQQDNTEFKAQSPEVKSYQLATAIVGTVTIVIIIGNVVAAICYVTHRRRKHRDRPIQSELNISDPYELSNRGAFETEHQYGQTVPVYEVPEAPYEIPK